MDIAGNAVTAIVTLLAVALGGWITIRSQDRSTEKDHARQWRDIRLAAYVAYQSAVRQYLAFALDPSSTIVSRPHPTRHGEMMPFFDSKGIPHLQQLDSARVAAALVCEHGSTAQAIQ